MTVIERLIQFTRARDFKYVRTLGEGGTGDTYLLLDETTDIEFTFKKFHPKQLDRRDDLYARFVDEIKILFKIFHPNVVRVYNYYLYPELKAGYIQMEYINGTSIEDFRNKSNGNEWNQIFVDLINAFKYLEQNKILHRDIRPSNIMIDYNGIPKVIDFGFGKEISHGIIDGNSVRLNWPVTELPEELMLPNNKYTHQTEIYFLGRLFKGLKLSSCKDFRYDYIISKMCKAETEDRYNSFSAISDAITIKELKLLEFSTTEKAIYKKFADSLLNVIAKYNDDFSPVEDVQTVISRLEKIVSIIDLEDEVQSLPHLIDCFIDNKYKYYAKREVKTKAVIDFYKMIIAFNDEKQKAVLDNLVVRLGKIEFDLDTEDLPF